MGNLIFACPFEIRKGSDEHVFDIVSGPWEVPPLTKHHYAACTKMSSNTLFENVEWISFVKVCSPGLITRDSTK